MRLCASLLLISLICRTPWAAAQSLVAETPPLTPAEQLARFHLPPGFEIQLVAQEPDVHKPMNMTFDAHGRLWVTHSLEYPFPAASDEAARDAISIFGDFDADGKARTVRRFAEHLNIPIGVLPLGDDEALAWSIPNIYRLVDADGDGVADQKNIVYGPFGVVDTHGDQNSFTRWIDGWIYANHGFANDSRVKRGGGGDEVIHMQSGNTYRFRPDGSAIEQYSWGQVNPFGLSFDPLGNLYSADCHSSAVSLLLREGYYQSFGKPHDGLGFAPEITHIDHGGTGIAGVVYSTLPDFPPEYRDVLFVGNVITNRIHCDRLKWTGSTPIVTKVEDFLTCDDPWFRPVDIQPGPDGALYVADFYNCIIGHYEVPLTHPKRDRERGRIWRIVYTGRTGEQSKPIAANAPMPDLHSLDSRELFALLAHPNLAVRVLATNYVLDAFPRDAAAMASELLSRDQASAAQPDAQDAQDAQARQAAHAVWILQRTHGIPEQIAEKLLSAAAPPLVQVHAAKALGETPNWQPWHFAVVRAALGNADPFVRRAASEALSKHPAADNLPPLLAALDATDQDDAQLYHEIRIALRDQIRSPEIADGLLALSLEPAQKQQLVAFAATAPTGPAAMLIVEEALQGRVRDEILLKALPAAARYVDAPRVDALVAYLAKHFPRDMAQQIAALRALAEGLAERGEPLTGNLQAALADHIHAVIARHAAFDWYNTPLPGSQATASPWVPQQRPIAGGGVIAMISSLPANGERLGGALTSPEFELPARLSFWVCGHNGLPDQPDRQLNYVRLVLADGTEAARSFPPRDDVARRVEWNLAPYAGRRGRIEVVDGITDLDGFAWLAVSRFEPAVVSLPDHAVGEQGAARADLIRLAGQLKLQSLAEGIAQVAADASETPLARLAATDALLSLDAQRATASLTAMLSDLEMPPAAREQAAQQLGQLDRAEARDALVTCLKSAPESLAVVIAASLAGRQPSAAALLDEIESGHASPELLLEPAVAERLKSTGLPDVAQRITVLAADLSPTDNRIARLIAERRAAFLAGHFDPEQGRAIFAKSICASCHRIGDVGATIGPALDGIGVRGLDRLLEDTLDPSRNVDAAFRTVTIVTAAGQSLSGFGLREEGANLVLYDAAGKPTRVPLADVDERNPSNLSPMPTNVIEQMPESDYHALLAYLLSLKKN
jgi:putative heme-binding domain-containing protein